jgi:hypothetical protein
MNAKYADVVKVAEAKEFIESLPDGLFELPRARRAWRRRRISDAGRRIAGRMP